VATVAGSTDVFGAWAPSKLVEIFLIASSMFFVWIIFTLTADRIIKARSEYSLGRKRYNYRDHVIVCGLGRFGYFIVEELVKRGEQVVVIESNENSANIEYIRSLGAEVYVGNARLVRVLQEVGVAKAKAVMSVTGDDYVNLEVGLNARSCNPSLRLILRIFDDAMAQAIREHLDIHLAYSMSALADDAFIATIDTIETVPIADGNQVVN
jgi:voltage-gated potassium channel Kch